MAASRVWRGTDYYYHLFYFGLSQGLLLEDGIIQFHASQYILKYIYKGSFWDWEDRKLSYHE